jgi:SSS family solute:Na+ symporter
MGWVTLILTALMVVLSLLTKRDGDEAKALTWTRSDFTPSGGFIVGSILIMGIIAALYALLW